MTITTIATDTKIRIAYRTREAAKVGQVYDHKAWMEKVRRLKWRCVYCHKKLTRKTLTLDHVIPFKKGGSWGIENLVPACGFCNNSKSDRPVEEFLPRLKAHQKKERLNQGNKKALANGGIDALLKHCAKNSNTKTRKTIVDFKIKNGAIVGAKVRDGY